MGKVGGEREEGLGVSFISCLFQVLFQRRLQGGVVHAVSPTDGAELPGAVQAGQVLSYFPRHGWGPSPGG